jgi:hypothetical protein
MGFLSKAMGQVLAATEAERDQREKIEAQRRSDRTEALRKEAELDLAEKEAQARERAFLLEFPDAQSQAKLISRYSTSFPMLAREGEALRGLAIAGWWTEQKHERIRA